MNYFEHIVPRHLDENIDALVLRERQASIKNVIFAVADDWEVEFYRQRCPCCGQDMPYMDSKLFLYKNGCATKVIPLRRKFLQSREAIMECAERISKKEFSFIKINN